MLPQQLQEEVLIIKNGFKNYSQYSVIELEDLKEECIKLQKKLYFYYEKTVALLTQWSSEYSASPIFAEEIQYINNEVQKITISKEQLDSIINMINYRIKALNTNYTQQKEKEIFNFLQQLITIENISAIKTYLQNTPINLNIDWSIFIMAMRVYRDEKSDVTLAILQLLIENGININAQNINGETGLHLAVMENNIEIVELLINAGADIEIETNDEETALCIAIAENNIQMVWLLFKNNANVSFEAKSGWNFLHLAMQGNNIDISKLLIERGVNINLQNRAGETPLHFAIWKGYIAIVLLLIENGADIEIKYNQGRSALCLAVCMDNLEIAQLLLDFGANINNEHSEHQAMLKIAQQNQNKKMIALLKSNASFACCNLL
jgi:hypothetical protein